MTAAVLPAVLVVVEVAASMLVATRIARRFFHTVAADPLERLTIGLLLTLLTMVMISQVAAAAGVFSRYPVLATHVVLAALVAWKVRVPPRADEVVVGRRWTPTVDSVLSLAAVGAGVAVLGLGIYVSLRRPTTEFDSLQYHMPDAVHWIQSHSIWHLPILSPPFADNAYPSNGELLSAWSMLATGESQLSMFSSLAFGVLLVLAAGLLARRLAGRAWLGGLAGLAVALAPIIYRNVDSLMTDYAGGAGVVLGLALLVGARQREPSGRWVLLAGLAIGLSVGAKDTALVFAALATGWLLVAPPSPSRSRAAPVALLLVGMLVPSGIWYLRDWIAVGNPLYPAGVTIFGHPVLHGTTSPYTIYRTTMLQHFIHLDRAAIHSWRIGLIRYLGPVAALSVLGVAVGGVVAVRHRDRGLLAVVTIAVLGMVAYLITPYTGGGDGRFPEGEILVIAQLRYVLVPLVVGTVVLVVMLPRWLGTVAVALAIAFAYDRSLVVSTELSRSRVETVAILVAAQLAVLTGLLAAARLFGGWTGFRARLRLAARAVRRRPVGPAVVAVGLALVTVGPATVALAHSVTFPRRYPPALATQVRPGGKVLELGVTDVTELLGPHLGRRLLTVGRGLDGNELPNRATFLRFLAAHHPAALVISPFPSVVDPGYIDAVRPPSSSWVVAGFLPDPTGVPDTIYLPHLPAT